MLYVNLNMVRTGAVTHPQEWFPSGYSEIQSPKQRYGLLSWPDLLTLLQMESVQQLQTLMLQQVANALAQGPGNRDSKWSESVAVGHHEFLEKIKDQLGFRIKGREVKQSNDLMHIREALSPQYILEGPYVLTGDNAFAWQKADSCG